MTKPINLNKVRKAKARADHKARADANAVRFGQTKPARQAQAAQSEKVTKLWAGHKVDQDDSPSG